MLAADTLVGVDKVDVVITAWSAGSVGPFGKYDVPYIHGETTDAAIAIGQEPGNGNVFASIDGQPAVSKTFYDALMDIPYEYPNNKIAVIGADDDYSRGVAEAYRDYAAADGWDVVMMEIVPYGTAEWGPILAKVRANEPALLHIEIPSPPEVISFFRQFMLDPTPTILSYGWSLPPAGFMSAMGEEANGLLGNTGGYVGWPPPTQEVADWVARFEAKFDGARPRGGPDNTYDITMMWAEAVRQVGDPSDYDAIVQWLQNNTFQAMPGFRVIDYDERNTAPEQNHPLAQAQVQDGEWFTLSHNVYGDPYVDYQGKSYEFQVPSWIE